MSSSLTSNPDRYLHWPDCYNARDLGGLATEAGKTTRWQALMRSDIVNRLTEEGRQALLDYGVRTIIDLRSPLETAEEPSLLASDGGVSYLNLPLEKYYPHVRALISQAETRGEVYAIILDHYPDAVTAVLQAIIEAEPGGILIHCQAGKDRTGIVSALLLRLVGVPVETVVADYTESQACLWPLYEKIVAEAGGEEEVDFWLKPTATEEMMIFMLDHLDSKYGGVESYLLASGLSAGEIDRLRSRLIQ